MVLEPTRSSLVHHAREGEGLAACLGAQQSCCVWDGEQSEVGQEDCHAAVAAVGDMALAGRAGH
eukprot:131253-Pelagomonas_calceolata.AAC.5